MRVILDTSTILGEDQSTFRYFSELVPRLRQQKELSLELLPSPYFDFPKEWSDSIPLPQPLLPKATWLPQGKIRKALSRVKWAIESRRQKQFYFDKKKEIPLFHSFLSTFPHSSQAILISMAHDTILEKLGLELGLDQSEQTKLALKKKAFEKAERIIAISDSTKNDVCSIYGISPEKVDRIYHAVNSDFFGAPVSPDQSQIFKGKHSISRPYVLQVGGRLHHRNFSRLAEAFATSGIQKDYLLVCAGERWSDEELCFLKKLGIFESVRLLPKPNTHELRTLYQGAEMLVYPSLYEGFGFPLVEAMAAGTPVATSMGAGSIQEVAAEAAIYFDPRNPHNMASVMSQLLNPKVALEYRKKGLENIKRFSWDKTAIETLACYQKAISKN